ncbi:MAG: peptidoglycan-binding protein, partial [Micrococcales bacterium]|nr:peptidoglycan-binding protein [Micrococcales bacterium]
SYDMNAMNNTLMFSQLAVGSYTFVVTASDSSPVSNKQLRSNSFTVTAGSTTVPTAIDLKDCGTVQAGQTSGCVTELQNLLLQQGYTQSVTGYFDSTTESNLKSFQTWAGKTATGTVNADTRTALYTRSKVQINQGYCATRTWKEGARGGCVASLQTYKNLRVPQYLLDQPGSASYAVDGHFGKGTYYGIGVFQALKCLTLDGEVGSGTAAALVNNTNACPSLSPTDPACPTGTTQVTLQAGQEVRVAGTVQAGARMCRIDGLPSGARESDSSSAFYVTNASGKAIVRSTVAKDWVDLVAAAKAAGTTLSANSTYRTTVRQIYICLYEDSTKNCTLTSGSTNVGRPGHSNHQGGKAIDFANSSTSDTAVFKWLNSNAKKYNITNYAPEPWHWQHD